MNNNNGTKSNTISVSEKLEISQSNEVFMPEIPEEIIYPNELNTYLREQLRYYIHKNGMLEKNLNELEERYSVCKDNVTKLECKLSGYENLCDKSKISTSSQIISSKIIELSKKLREKTSEVESMKSKYSKLEKHTFDLKNQLENDSSQKLVKEQIDSIQNSITEDEIKKYNDKVSHLTSKISEAKNMNMQLKKDLQVAKKILHQEVGESFENLQAITNTNVASWRGRAQVICDLQKKNSELKEKLKQAQEKCHPTTVDISSHSIKMEAQLAGLMKENLELKSKLEETKKKHEAAKARIKVLDTECTMSKSKLSMMKEQATRDQDIISTLSKQLNSSKEVKNELLLQKEHTITKLQTENKQILQEMDEYKNIIKNLREEINALNNIANEVKKQDVTTKKETLRSVTHKDPIKMENKGTDHDNKYEDILEVIENMNKRLIMEREAHAKTLAALRLEKQKVTKAESIIARQELETSGPMRSSYSSSNNLKPLDPNLRDKLELAEESLKAVQTRLEIEQIERRADLQTFAQILKTYDIQIPQNDE